MEKKHLPAKRWLYLALGTVTMLCIGTIYGWSVLKVPLAQTFGWQPTSLTLAYSLAFVVFCAGNILGSLVQKKIGFRIVLLTGSVAIFAGYFLVSLIETDDIRYLYLCFSFLVGGGMGVVYPLLLDLVGRWFPDQNGLCSGVLTMGFGSSALLLVRPVAALFSVAGIGWRGAYRILGYAALFSLLLCVLILRVPSSDASASARKLRSERSFTTAEMLRHSSFWLLFIYLIFNGVTGAVVVALAYDYCISLAFSSSVAATLVGVVAVFNGASRILFGRLFDKFGYKLAVFVGSCCVILSGVLLLLAVFFQMKALAIAGLMLAGLGYGYGPVINPILIRAFFGPDNFATNYSFSNTRAMVGMMIPVAFTAFLVKTGSFIPVLSVALCCSAVGFGLQYLVKAPNKDPL